MRGSLQFSFIIPSPAIITFTFFFPQFFSSSYPFLPSVPFLKVVATLFLEKPAIRQMMLVQSALALSGCLTYYRLPLVWFHLDVIYKYNFRETVVLSYSYIVSSRRFHVVIFFRHVVLCTCHRPPNAPHFISRWQMLILEAVRPERLSFIMTPFPLAPLSIAVSVARCNSIWASVCQRPGRLNEAISHGTETSCLDLWGYFLSGGRKTNYFQSYLGVVWDEIILSCFILQIWKHITVNQNPQSLYVWP